MVTTLAKVTLKSGESMAVVKTTAPEPDWIDRLLPFLSHKGDSWLEPMRQAYSEGLDALTMNDFLGVLDSGEIVGNVTTIEHLGVGVLQHVFTPPEHRRKGIASALFRGLCGDFTARSCRAMYLSTGYDTPPYHIYESFGFVGRGDSGKMTWLPDAGFLETHFAPGPASIRDTRWEDWPLLEALYAITGQWQLKSFYFQQFGHAAYEGEYIGLRQGLAKGSILGTRVLSSPEGAILGHALLAKQSAWRGRPLVLDFMVHANFHERAAELAGSLKIPGGVKVQAFCDAQARAKIAALETLGFEQEGCFRGQIEDENHVATDVLVFGKVG